MLLSGNCLAILSLLVADMKRTRRFVECCDICEMQFESNSSYLRHCNSQNHKMRLIVTESGATLETDEELAYFSDDSEGEGEDFSYASVPISSTKYSLQQETITGYQYSYEDTSQTPPVDSDSELKTTIGGDARSTFYPFPDEKFFLLYCYAHGIMRPKVRNTLYTNFYPFFVFFLLTWCDYTLVVKEKIFSDSRVSEQTSARIYSLFIRILILAYWTKADNFTCQSHCCILPI